MTQHVTRADDNPQPGPGALRGRRVQIVGAGIGGLAAALALAQRGASVLVRERAGALREVGAGIQLSPNAGHVLARLGLASDLDAIAPRIDGVRLWDQGARPVARLDYRRLRPATPFRAVHRARLVALLEDRARAAGVTVRLGDPVGADDDPEDADLVIGADGVHSTIRNRLDGASAPFFTGQTAWRALIPCGPDAAPQTDLFMGDGRHLVSYPLGGGLRNIVAVVARPIWSEDGWSHRGEPADLRAAFADFAGPVPGWLAAVDQVGVWGLVRRPVARRWQDGRFAILGDAAHSTLPFVAQGACMAIEDGWVLAACLDADPDQRRALARYEALRRPRCARIVAAANANAHDYHLTGWRRGVAHALLRTASRMAPHILYRRVAWIHDFDPTRGFETDTGADGGSAAG